MDHDEMSGQLAPTNLVTIWTRVQTARLLLRRLQPTDGPAMFRVHGDPATYHYSPAALHPDLATSEEMLRSCLHHWETSGFGYWAVTLARQETIVGFGGVEYRRWHDWGVLNLYYRFTPSAWGQGYATELAQRAVNMAREHLPIFPVIARTRPANLAAQQVAQKVGLLRWPEQESEGEYAVFALGWEQTELNQSR